MKKYLEQRLEELELEVKLLKAKIKLNETKDTSKYLNNYPKYDPFKDYMYNSNANSTYEFNSETILPPYPDIWDSWDEKNPEDVISEKSQTTIPDWGVTSEFDKTDKDFLKWLKSHEAKNAYEISKNITNKYGKSEYRPFKVK